ncbi:ABC transporter substrate-binding protein [Celeribacter sp.]|uniref:ABC transporter substrate-binding protein n=1 Tax=Celeribacter sp. TaxID=1890673 RepID=UPI003A90BD40
MTRSKFQQGLRGALVGLCLCAVPVAAQEAIAQFSAQGALSPTELLVRSTTDIAILAPALTAFVEANPRIAITYEQWGSNALYSHSRAACEGTAKSADVVISSGVHQMLDLVNRACASPYVSTYTAALPSARKWRNELWGITQEAAVIIYNTALVPDEDAPRTRFALLDLMRRQSAQYRGRIATYDIERSGLGFLFAFMDSQEATTFGGLLEGFSRVDAVATCCSAEIIKGVERGEYLIAYNVLGSYVASAPHENLGVIYPKDYTLFLSRAFMIPKTAQRAEQAAQFLDFLLSPEGEQILAQSNLVQRQDGIDPSLPQSAQRYISIDITLLVAMDQHRRASFVEKWRATFGDELR